jgi:peptide deformylase
VAVLPIICYEDELLRRVGEPVDDPGTLRGLARDMGETMLAGAGVGLAAPQVGESVRLVVVHPRVFPELTVPADGEGGEAAPIPLVNPEYEPLGGLVSEREGCLSIPEIYGRVARYERVRLRAQDLDGGMIDHEFEGLAARAIQHEVDHLDGVLFVDRLSKAQRMLLYRRLKALDARTKRGWRRIVPDGIGG